MSALPAGQYRTTAEGLGPCHGWCTSRESLRENRWPLLRVTFSRCPEPSAPCDSKALCSLLLCVGTFTVLNPWKGDQDMICMETEATLSSKSSPGPLSGGLPSSDCLGKSLTSYPSTGMGLGDPAQCSMRFPLPWSKLPSRGEGGVEWGDREPTEQDPP